MTELLPKLLNHGLQKLIPSNAPSEERVVHLADAIIPYHRLMVLMFNMTNITGEKCRFAATRRTYYCDITCLCSRKYLIKLAFKNQVLHIGSSIDIEDLRQSPTVYFECLEHFLSLNGTRL